MSQNEFNQLQVTGMLKQFQGLGTPEKVEFLKQLAESMPQDKGSSFMDDVFYGWGGKIVAMVSMISGVKWFKDHRVSKTGNVAVETHTHGRPTFFTDKTIEWFGFVLGGEEFNDEVMLLVKADRLRALAEVCSYSRMGDGNASEGYLVPLQWLISTTSAIRTERQRRSYDR